MHVMIDTNIIIDSIASREPYNIAAETIVLLAAGRIIKASITASTATDIYYLTKRRLGDSDKAKAVLQKLYSIFGIASVDKNDCLKALDIAMDDYEDAVLAVCAKRIKADYIITRNLKDFCNSPVKPISPDDFLNQFFPTAMGKT